MAMRRWAVPTCGFLQCWIRFHARGASAGVGRRLAPPSAAPQPCFRCHTGWMNSIDRSTDTRAAEVRVPLEAIKGRGTATYFPHRFERDARESFDDGWEHGEDDAAGVPKTEVIWETARSIIATNDSPDIYFDQ